MSKNRLPRCLDGWVEFPSDVNWEDYGGSWGRRAKDGSWYLVAFENKEEWGDGATGFYCSVKWCDLPNIPKEKIAEALRSCGWELTTTGKVQCPHDGTFVAEEPAIVEQVIVSCLVGYGVSGELDSEERDNRPVWLLCEMVRRAKVMIKDTKPMGKTARAKRKPHNRIGTTIAEAARGDGLAGLRKYQEDGFQPQDPTKDLMWKLMGGQL